MGTRQVARDAGDGSFPSLSSPGNPGVRTQPASDRTSHPCNHQDQGEAEKVLRVAHGEGQQGWNEEEIETRDTQ